MVDVRFFLREQAAIGYLHMARIAWVTLRETPWPWADELQERSFERCL